MRVSNNKARQYVEKLEEFQGSNTFGKWHSWGEGASKLFVVYSYGHHFPMYVYDQVSNMWIGNKDKFSQSTTRHQSQLRPSSIGLWVDTDDMQSIARDGILGYCINQASNS